MKPELIFFSEYKIGGVQSFYFNLLKYDPYNHLEKTWLLVRHAGDSDALPPQPFGAIPNERVITFSESDNIYDKAKKISQYLNNRPGAMITNFTEDLVAIQHFTKKPKTVFFICHDEGYVSPAVTYEFLIDVFITHNPYYFDELCRLMPSRRNTIFYLPYGVNRAPRTRRPNLDQPLNILFLARMHKLKGVLELPLFDDLLNERGIPVQWTVIGDGPEKSELEKLVRNRTNFEVKTLPTLDDVLDECPNHDIFILPSYKDGTPVAMLESMSAGLVPVMYKFNPGIEKIINRDLGFISEAGDKEGLVSSIIRLNDDRRLLETMSLACHKIVEEKYDVRDRVRDYYDLFYQYSKFKRRKRLRFIRHSGWLDLPFVPASLRRAIRKVRR